MKLPQASDRPSDEPGEVFRYSPANRFGRYAGAAITTAVIVYVLLFHEGDLPAWSFVVLVGIVAADWVLHVHMWRSPLKIRIQGGILMASDRRGKRKSWPLAELYRSSEDSIGHWIGGTKVCTRDGVFAFRVWKVIENFEDLKGKIPEG